MGVFWVWWFLLGTIAICMTIAEVPFPSWGKFMLLLINTFGLAYSLKTVF